MHNVDPQRARSALERQSAAQRRGKYTFVAPNEGLPCTWKVPPPTTSAVLEAAPAQKHGSQSATSGGGQGVCDRHERPPRGWRAAVGHSRDSHPLSLGPVHCAVTLRHTLGRVGRGDAELGGERLQRDRAERVEAVLEQGTLAQRLGRTV
jgi:hypothetical protein